MLNTDCPKCLWVRTGLLALVLGMGAGYLAIHFHLGREASMAATFFGALIPVLWFARQGSSRKR